MEKNHKNRIVYAVDPIYENKERQQRILRVAIYIRVSTDSSDQMNSLYNQKMHYESIVLANPNWEYVGLYADDGISGTSTRNRKEFNRLLADCKAGKIDLIIVKDVSRFARNVVDCLNTTEFLQTLDPPVGIYFENNNLNTLDVGTKLFLTIFAMVAELESASKSDSVRFGNNVCFERGDYFSPTRLLGYKKVGKYEMEIEPEGANTVRLIYDLFLAGYSLKEIAEVLTLLSRLTATGRVKWSPGSVARILQNEKHCGDFIMQKTFVENYLTHKVIRNRGQRKLYHALQHHKGIVTKAEHVRALLLLKSNPYSPYYNHLFVIKIIRQGLLSGFIPLNPAFGGYNACHYLYAFEISRIPFPKIETEVTHIVGAKPIRREFFHERNTAAVTLSRLGIFFNPGCISLMKETEYVEMLLNPMELLLAVRKTTRQNRNAIPWKPLSVRARELTRIIYQLMGWQTDWKYKATAHYFSKNNQQVIIFDLASCVFQFREGKKLIKSIPSEWISEFGEDFSEHAMLCRRALAKKLENWKLSATPSHVDGIELGVVHLTREQAEERITEMRYGNEK